MVAMMNVGHSAVARWGLQFLECLRRTPRCWTAAAAAGRISRRLLKKCPEGIVKGIDYSPVSVEKSKKVNEAAVTKGRCDVLCASVAELPFESEQFDAGHGL